jgi:hypothetical protein
MISNYGEYGSTEPFCESASNFDSRPSPIQPKPKPPLTMADLPPACRQVLMD